MGRYIARRLLVAVPVLIGATFLIFAMVYALPGDPIRALAGDRSVPPSVVAQLRADFHLDEPLLVQYALYVGDLLQGDLGTDFHRRPVLDTIAATLPVTLTLAAVALVFEVLIGLAAGVLAGIRRNGFLDNLVLVSTTVLVSVPVLALAFLAQYLFGQKLGWFPVAGTRDGLVGYVLPGLVLAAGSLAYVARLTRTSVAENARADHVRTARAKGLPRRTVLLRHVLRPGLLPVVTFLGADLGTLLGGAVVTESVFDLPGMGREVFEAIRAQEGAVVVGVVTLMVAFFLLVNLIVDILYAVLDPRIRHA